MSDSDDHIITLDDQQHLEQLQLIAPAPNGRRRISRSALYSEASEISTESGDSGYAASENFPSVEIPTLLHSLETLVYLGYNERKAAELWQRWEQRGDLPDDFLKCARAAIWYNPADALDNDDAAWMVCLGELGINQETAHAIMDASFKDVRLLESCKHWALDTMELRFESLCAAHQASRAREESRRVSGPEAPSSRNVSDASASEHPQVAS
jgi:hypothetical protein